METTQNTLERIRSLLYEKPQARTFREICRAIDGSSPQESLDQVLFSYLDAHLQTWGDDCREMPMSWLREHLGSSPSQTSCALDLEKRTALVRRLSLSSCSAWSAVNSKVGTQEFLQSGLLAQMVDIDLQALSSVVGSAMEAMSCADLQVLDLQRTYQDGPARMAKIGVWKALHTLYLSGRSFFENRWVSNQYDNAIALSEAEAFPALRTLELAGWETDDKLLDIVGSSALVHQLTSLRMKNYKLGSRVARRFFEHLRAPNLRALDVSKEGIVGFRMVEALTRNKHLKLRELHMLSCWIEDEAIEAISRASNMSALEHLSVSVPEHGRLTNRSAIALATSPKLKGLQSLELRSGSLGDRGIGRLLRAPWCEQLRRLHLSSTELGPWISRALRRGPLPQIEDFALYGADLRQGRLQELLTGLPTHQLRALTLVSCTLGTEEMRVLARCSLHKIESLTLSHNPLGEEALYTLAQAPWLGEVKTLNLCGLAPQEAWSSEVWAVLGASLQTLEGLDLGVSPVGDEGVRRLIEVDLPQLRSLGLHRTKMTHKGCEMLARAQAFALLESLNLYSNGMTPEIYEMLSTCTQWRYRRELSCEGRF